MGAFWIWQKVCQQKLQNFELWKVSNRSQSLLVMGTHMFQVPETKKAEHDMSSSSFQEPNLTVWLGKA